MERLGFEPRTYALKGRYSTIELPFRKCGASGIRTQAQSIMLTTIAFATFFKFVVWTLPSSFRMLSVKSLHLRL